MVESNLKQKKKCISYLYYRSYC